MSGVRALIPDAVFPRSDDTPRTLANRLSGCKPTGWTVSLPLRVSGSLAACTTSSHVRHSVSAASLLMSVRAASLADIHVPRYGRRGRVTRLNALCLPQPRRVTWSVLVGDYEEGAETQTLFCYTQALRRPDDWRCRPMPMELYRFGLHLWEIAFSYLGPISKQHPPTACQLMLCEPRFPSHLSHLHVLMACLVHA